MGDPAYRGIYAYGAASSAGTLAADVRYTDGSAPSLVLPDWQLLTIDSVVGSLAIINGDGVEFAPEWSVLEIQASAFVGHSYGRYVIFGYGWDDDEPVEFGRIQVNSNEPVLTITRKTIQNNVGATLKIYISSDFEWSAFSWQNAEIIGVGIS